jgi:hypothetical protein
MKQTTLPGWYPWRYLPVITLLIAFSSGRSFAQEHTGGHPDWMSKARSLIQDLPINQVPILGAHDASSCYLNENSPPSTGYLEHDGKHLTHLPGAEGVSRGKCQSVSITGQLNYGVRYLVLPIAYQDGQYWTIHMWLAKPLFGDDGLFQEILAFLNNHPDEIILLNLRAPLFSDTGPMTTKQEIAFYKKLYNELKGWLIPKGNFGQTTFGQIWQGTGRLLIIGNPAGDNPDYPFIWDENKKEDVWMDTQDPNELMSDLTNELKSWTSHPTPGYLFVLQGMTTTKEKLQNAEITNSMLRQMLQNEWHGYPINILQVDDAAKSGLIPLLLGEIGPK